MTPQMAQVLVALALRPMYVYGLMSQCEHDSGGTLVPSIGSIYKMMPKLVAMGFVIEFGQRYGIASPHMRTYYQLTGLGYKVLGWEGRRLEHLTDVINQRKVSSFGAKQPRFS
jgi:DNA-binding PadR family transcriptional regulator